MKQSGVRSTSLKCLKQQYTHAMCYLLHNKNTSSLVFLYPPGQSWG